MEECHKLLTDQVDDAILRYNVSKLLPLGGDPGHVTIQPDLFFNKDLEYLWYGAKLGKCLLVNLENEGCLLSDGRLIFPMYGYNYMKKIVLRRADLKEYVIAERDFKYMYPSDFEDLYLLTLQGHLNHLSPEDKKILTTALSTYGPDYLKSPKHYPCDIASNIRCDRKVFTDEIENLLEQHVQTSFRWVTGEILNGSIVQWHRFGQIYELTEVVSLVDVVLDGAFGGVREEEVVVGDGVKRFSLSLVMSTNSCFGGMIVSLIFLNPWEEEACVSMEV
ncbi:hypothetical protein Tco_0392501 [Tanacetum coccineum]